jgi:hypothetical protein
MVIPSRISRSGWAASGRSTANGSRNARCLHERDPVLAYVLPPLRCIPFEVASDLGSHRACWNRLLAASFARNKGSHSAELRFRTTLLAKPSNFSPANFSLT